MLKMMDTRVGFALPDGGVIVDDVYGHYPGVGLAAPGPGIFPAKPDQKGLGAKWKKGLNILRKLIQLLPDLTPPQGGEAGSWGKHHC